MRIKEIKIDRYGPLPPIHWRLNKGIQPIYGPNESGKTLIIEALLKMLVGEKVILPREIDRISEKPEGYLLLFDNSGNEIKLERAETLSELLGIEQEDIKNIFVVRNTDLKIENEDLFYDRVTDRLTGLRTKDIQRIIKKLGEMGRLTEMLKISDSEEHNKANSQIRKAKKLMNDIKRYIEKSEKNGIRDLETAKLELEAKEAELKEKSEILKIKKWSNSLKIVQSKSKELSKIPKIDIPTLKNELEEIESDETKCLRFRRDETFYRRLCYASIIAYAISLAVLVFMGLIFNSNSLILGCVLWIILPISLFLRHRANCNLAGTELKLKSITSKLKTLGLRTGNIHEIKREIDGIEKRKKNLENVLQQNIGILKDSLGIESDSAEEVLERAKIKLKKLQETRGLVRDLSYRKGELEEVEKERVKITEDLNQLETSLKEHNNALKEFSRRLNEINFRGFLHKELDLIIENLESLQQLSKHLEIFTQKIEEDANLSKVAIRIFKQMESEESRKISKLFGVNSKASEIFREVTDGRYTKIDYDHENKEIFVERSTGGMFYPSKELSGTRGTVDQIYLAIRIALGNDILKGETGFFILDDPFVFSDETRIKNQLNLLKKLSEMGWQILYFTSNRNICELISQITSNRTIELGRIP